MTYLPLKEEVELLMRRHNELPKTTIKHVVAVADAVRKCEDVGGLSVRATEEACTFLGHRIFADDPNALSKILRSSFCGRFPRRLDDRDSDAGIVWALVTKVLGKRGGSR